MRYAAVRVGVLLTTGLILLPGPPGKGQLLAAEAAEIVPRECLVVPPVGSGGRTPVHRDAIEAAIVSGKWTSPKAGTPVTLPDGSTRTWKILPAAAGGAFHDPALRGGYAYVPVTVDSPRTMILEARGHGMVYVNGEPREGDPYEYGFVHLPISLRKGINDLLFQSGRGNLHVKLVPPRGPVFLDTGDMTLPDLIVGEPVDTRGAVIVVNATTAPLDGLHIIASSASLPARGTALPPLPPLSVRKVGFDLRGAAPRATGQHEVKLLLVGQDADRNPSDTAAVTLRVRPSGHSYKRTFRSGIDDSVQYYAVQPAQTWGRHGAAVRPALVLTLHGASVEAIGQADAYAPKTWAHLVAPTNRRPYGFDWEDWGRLDALEVLDLAQAYLHTDPQRTYLTGHSMGGHGVWHLGALYPDRFAAIGPSAGWVSMWSYAGARRQDESAPVVELLRRAATPSDTLALARNYAHSGVYVLHGDKDDNVPVTEARRMKQELAGFHHDFLYHEQAGAGHWWSNTDEPGSACVDWAPLFDFFARHAIPADEAVRDIDFVTPSPGVSAWSHWIGIEAQIKPLQPSSVHVRCDPHRHRFVGTTNNVSRLALDVGHLEPGRPIQVELDGQKIADVPWPEKARRIWLLRVGERWSIIATPSPSLKGPHRYGPFKEAFRNRVQLVYGTRGTPEENAWAFAKARFDSETFWYRGNGSLGLIPDTAFDPAAERDRNVILYGNADTNAAWKALLADSPVQVRRGRVLVGERDELGSDLACLFLRPRPGSDRALVGVVTGSGLAGMRLTDRLPYFISGVAYPDCVVFGPAVLSRGSAAVRVAGFFGADWSVSAGEFAWNK